MNKLNEAKQNLIKAKKIYENMKREYFTEKKLAMFDKDAREKKKVLNILKRKKLGKIHMLKKSPDQSSIWYAWTYNEHMFFFYKINSSTSEFQRINTRERY